MFIGHQLKSLLLRHWSTGIQYCYGSDSDTCLQMFQLPLHTWLMLIIQLEFVFKTRWLPKTFNYGTAVFVRCRLTCPEVLCFEILVKLTMEYLLWLQTWTQLELLRWQKSCQRYAVLSMVSAHSCLNFAILGFFYHTECSQPIVTAARKLFVVPTFVF